MLSRADLDAYCTPERQARRPSRLRQSRHRRRHRLARPWAVAWLCGMALAEKGRKHRRHDLYRAERRRGAGRLDLGGGDDGLLAAAATISSPSSTTMTSRASAAPPRRIRASIPLLDKFRAFGWEAVEVDGHDSRGDLRGGDRARKGGRPFMVGGQDHQGQGRELHGKRADLALPLAQQGRVPRAPSRAGGGADEEHLLRRRSTRKRRRTRTSTSSSPTSRRPAAWRSSARNIPSASSMSASPSRA